MKFPVDVSLFDDTKHSPSIFALTASMGGAPGRLRDYCIPVNPYFPTPEVFARLRERFQAILKFYPSSNQDIAARLAEFVGLDPDTIVLGNGSTELISWINRLLVTQSLAIPVPTFSRWTEDPTLSGKKVHTFLRVPERNFRLTPGEFVAGVLRRGARAAVLCNPNNPTGALMEPADVLRVLEALSDLDVVIIDESFIDFAAEDRVPSIDREVTRFPNAIVLKSLGKNLGLHGLRMGYAVGHPDLIARLRGALPFWNLSSVAQALIEELAGARAEYEAGRARVVRDRVYLESRLRAVPGLRVYPAQANFVYVRMPDGIEGVTLRNHLLTEHGCLVRECGNKLGSDSQHFRIAARPTDEVDYLIDALAQSFAALTGVPRRLADPAATGVLPLLGRPSRSQRFRRTAMASSLVGAALLGVLGGFAIAKRAPASPQDIPQPPVAALALPVAAPAPTAGVAETPAAPSPAAPAALDPASGSQSASASGDRAEAQGVPLVADEEANPAGDSAVTEAPLRAPARRHKKLRLGRSSLHHKRAHARSDEQETSLASRDRTFDSAD
jgi:histidinol-phosphate/aromatic aminotransferase/cobyric acid decarboxylase-like protein